MKITCPNCGFTGISPDSKVTDFVINLNCPKCKQEIKVHTDNSDWIKNSIDFKCPKCGQAQESGDTCVRCGIIYTKYYEKNIEKLKKNQKNIQDYNNDNNNLEVGNSQRKTTENTPSDNMTGKCRLCGVVVSKTAKVCPQCGVEHPVVNLKGCFRFFGFLFLFVLILIFIGRCSSSNKSYKSNHEGSSYTTPSAPSPAPYKSESAKKNDIKEFCELSAMQEGVTRGTAQWTIYVSSCIQSASN